MSATVKGPQCGPSERQHSKKPILGRKSGGPISPSQQLIVRGRDRKKEKITT